MIAAVIVTFVDLFVPVFSGILLARVIMSYIAKPGNRFMEWLIGITEPLLGPIRKILPATPGLDFTPLVALFLLQGLQSLVNSAFAH